MYGFGSKGLGVRLIAGSMCLHSTNECDYSYTGDHRTLPDSLILTWAFPYLTWDLAGQLPLRKRHSPR